MTYRLNRVGIIDHSLFGDFLCDDHGRWQRASESSDDFIPNYDDILHLGRIGIRILAQDLKRVVISKSKSQSTARYGGGRGEYRRAVSHGGYQQNGYRP